MGVLQRQQHDKEGKIFGRAFGHWTFQQEASYFDDLSKAPASTRHISLRRTDKNWPALHRLKHLVEITAISPTREQRELIFSLPKVKRLRLWNNVRVSLKGLPQMQSLKELALFNVSGPRDLSDVAQLSNLRSLLIENMRSLEDHSDLGQLSGLECLCLSNGFVEARASVHSFAFLAELSKLRHLFCDLDYKSKDAAGIAAIANCGALETVTLNPYSFSVDAHAFLHAALPDLRAQLPHLLWVQGHSERFAHTVADAEGLPGDEMVIDPRVRLTAGLAFIRFRRGPRDAILAQARAFEDYFEQAIEKAEQQVAAVKHSA